MLAPREPVRLLAGQGAHVPSPNLDLKVPGMQAARMRQKTGKGNKKQRNKKAPHCHLSKRAAAVTSAAERRRILTSTCKAQYL